MIYGTPKVIITTDQERQIGPWRDNKLELRSFKNSKKAETQKQKGGETINTNGHIAFLCMLVKEEIFITFRKVADQRKGLRTVFIDQC